MGCRFCLRIDRGIATAMASGALRQPGMVHARRRKSGEVLVAGVALGCCRDVIDRLAERIGAVVASRAPSRHGGSGSRMIERSGRPGRRRGMAGIALCSRHNVGGRFRLGIC